MVRNTPWSSSGMKEVGSLVKKKTMPPIRQQVDQAETAGALEDIADAAAVPVGIALKEAVEPAEKAALLRYVPLSAPV